MSQENNTEAQAKIDDVLENTSKSHLEIDTLSLGIQFHEQSKYSIASVYFFLASKKHAPIGNYLLAVSLRNGLGIQKNEALSLMYLKKSIESIITCCTHLETQSPNLSNLPVIQTDDSLLKFTLNGQELMDLIQGKELVKNELEEAMSPLAKRVLQISSRDSTKNETLKDDLELVKAYLPLPLFELGVCFQQGWGIRRDLKKATELFTMAARLGDLDSMIQLSQLYQGFNNSRKEKFKAAFWLKQAEKLGFKSVNQTWIYKPKYDNVQSDVELLNGEIDHDVAIVKEILAFYKQNIQETSLVKRKSWIFRK